MKIFIKEAEIRRYIKSLINEMRAYHGSQARFSKFDSSFNGRGEGSAAFGPGHYFTNSKNIARDYAMEHGTSQTEIPKITYKGVDGDSIYQARLLFNDLNKCVRFEDYDKQHQNYLWRSLPKLMCTANNKNEFIATVYQYLVDAVKDKEDYEEDKDWYDYSLKKALKLLQSKIEEATRTLYQVELPDEDKFADWLMEVPEEWYGTLRKMLEERDDGDMYMDKLNDAFNRFISRDGKLTVGTLYYLLNNMHYDATFGDMLFKLLLQRYGYIGVKYPSGTNFQTSSTKEGDMNYTVFNDNDIEIKKRWDF